MKITLGDTTVTVYVTPGHTQGTLSSVFPVKDNGQAHVRGKQFCYDSGLSVPLIIRWPTNFAAPRHFKAGSVDTRLLEAIDLAPTMLAIAGAPIPDKMQGQTFLGANAAPPKQYVFGARDRWLVKVDGAHAHVEQSVYADAEPEGHGTDGYEPGAAA